MYSVKVFDKEEKNKERRKSEKNNEWKIPHFL